METYGILLISRKFKYCTLFFFFSETAMLLPASLASKRLSNESQDIRHNLKYRLSKEPVDLDSKE